MKVHSISDHDTRSWRTDIMTQIFNTNDLGKIQNMHLIDTEIEDDRIFSVRSAYYLLNDMLSHDT